MGNNIFGVDVAALVGQAFSGQLAKATLTKLAQGARTPGQLTGGLNPTPTTYSGIDAAMTEYEDGQLDASSAKRGGSTVKKAEREITLIANSIAGGTVKPEEGDRIELEGKTWYVVSVKRDPAAASYTCRVRK